MEGNDMTPEQLVHEMASFITDNKQILDNFLQVMQLKGYDRPDTLEEVNKLKLPG